MSAAFPFLRLSLVACPSSVFERIFPCGSGCGEYQGLEDLVRARQGSSFRAAKQDPPPTPPGRRWFQTRAHSESHARHKQPMHLMTLVEAVCRVRLSPDHCLGRSALDPHAKDPERLRPSTMHTPVVVEMLMENQSTDGPFLIFSRLRTYPLGHSETTEPKDLENWIRSRPL
ncbi:hypothetical protein IWZ01DRAFT_72735 [Phyllosticta capitalensis]